MQNFKNIAILIATATMVAACSSPEVKLDPTPVVEKPVEQPAPVADTRDVKPVETGSTDTPSLSATCSSTSGAMLAKVPTAPEMAQVAISARAAISRARQRSNSA